MALLASWGRRSYDCRDSDWKKVINFKYATDKPNLYWGKPGLGSPFWKSLTWSLEGAKTFTSWIPGNGVNIAFWHDSWIGGYSLKTRFWELFDICQQQDATVVQVWDGNTLQLTFRRCVDDIIVEKWYDLCEIVSNFTPGAAPDFRRWKLETSGISLALRNK